jgi:hypothetical protein
LIGRTLPNGFHVARTQASTLHMSVRPKVKRNFVQILIKISRVPKKSEPRPAIETVSGKRTISGGTVLGVKPPDEFAASHLMSNPFFKCALAVFRTEAQISVEGENFVVDETKSAATVMTAHVNLLDAFYRGIETELLPR